MNYLLRLCKVFQWLSSLTIHSDSCITKGTYLTESSTIFPGYPVCFISNGTNQSNWNTLHPTKWKKKKKSFEPILFVIHGYIFHYPYTHFQNASNLISFTCSCTHGIPTGKALKTSKFSTFARGGSRFTFCLLFLLLRYIVLLFRYHLWCMLHVAPSKSSVH